jgi:hypothetical protein
MTPEPPGRVRPTALAALRRFLTPRAERERCDWCDVELADVHAHVLEVASRQLRCVCDACGLLFADPAAAKYRRVPRRREVLQGFRMTDVQWESLQLPINLAFFVQSTAAGRALALYPSPAGATEAQPAAEAWQDLVEDNPVLRELEPDVEALLVNRLGAAAECYRVGIDECYRLVGLIRAHWRGLSGGTEVWKEVAAFFTGLRGRCEAAGGAGHA